MNRLALTGVVLVVVAGAAAIYFMQDPSEPSQETASGVKRPGDRVSAATTDVERPGEASTGTSTHSLATVPPDPRLDVFKISSDNGLIDFVIGDNGKVIKEIDKDPNSIGFGKTTREYLYFGNRVVGLTAYQYLGHTTQVTKTQVAYNPDGSVQDIQESTSFVGPEKKPGQR